MKFPSVKIIACVTILIAAAFACTSGTWRDESEPPCGSEIQIEDYEGPQHMILGIGMGGLPALDIALDNPEFFAAGASLGGPIDLQILLGQIKANLEDFDGWSEFPDRKEYLGFLRDLFIALGNPCYDNPLSLLYPPGTTGAGREVVSGFVDALNPGGTYPSITFVDESGFNVDFLLAVDLNRNSLRDPGEPIICQLHEPFTDQNGDGIHDAGEPFDDFGIDGVAGSGDFGEGDGAFDVNPRIPYWLDHSPAERVKRGEINTASRFLGALYLESGKTDFWNFMSHADSVADGIDLIYETAAEPEPFHCIEFATGRYDAFRGNFPFPTDPIWFPEKNVRLFWGPAEDEEDNHLGDDETQVARWSNALSFLEARVPNGFFGNDPKGSQTHYETHSFKAPSLGEDVSVEYSVFLPAGYYDKRSRWKTYPLLLVLLDAGQTPEDVMSLLETQGALVEAGFGQQTVVAMVRGERSAQLFQSGYGFFMDQAASESAGSYRQMIMTDLIDHLTSKYRIKSRNPLG